MDIDDNNRIRISPRKCSLRAIDNNYYRHTSNKDQDEQFRHFVRDWNLNEYHMFETPSNNIG